MNEDYEFKPAKSIQAFMPVGGGIQVKLRTPGAPPAPLGKPFMGPAHIFHEPKPMKLPDQRPMSAEPPSAFGLAANLEPGLPPPPAPMPAPVSKVDDPQVRISVERIIFLERLEKLMGDDSRVKELEAENKMLIRAIARLQEELDGLKGKTEKVMA